MGNWREIPPVPYDVWRDTIRKAGGPEGLASQAAWEAAREHSALALAMLHRESSYGTAFNRNRPDNHNPLNIRPPDGIGYMEYTDLVDGVTAWRERITDPVYKNGIYRDTETIEQLINVYAPAHDSNDEGGYVRSIESDLKKWGVSDTNGETSKGDLTMPDVTFGLVPAPPIVQLICDKPYEGAGFYRVPARQNVGVCEHITDGHGSIEFYSAFFSTGGERATDALVDFVIGRDGRIGMLNDWRGTRAPWANGNKLGMEGDGPKFYQRFGVKGIDQQLVSIEHEGFPTEAWPGEQWNAAVNLDAFLFDQMGVRFDSYPVHQDYGVVTHMTHNEFTNKGGNGPNECPGSWFRSRINEFQADVKSVLMAHQLTAVEPPPDAPDPPIDTSAQPFEGFAHGLATGSDQHVGKQTYYYTDRVMTVRAGRHVPKYTEPGGINVETIDQGTKIRSAFIADIKDDAGKVREWLIDHSGYSYNRSGFTPKLTVPQPLK